MNYDEYPRLKKFLDETGMTLDEAYKYTDKRLKELDKKYETNDDDADKVIADGKKYKQEKSKYDDWTFNELYAEAKRRGII